MNGYDNLKVSKYVVAAMCGCWKRESGVNPAIWESLIPCAWDFQYDYTNKGGFGLGQWTNVGTSHGRLYNLHTWVTDNGYGDGDGDGQLEYILVENYWTPKPAAHLGYQSLSEFLESNSTSIDDLVWDFLACWEGVTGDAYDERLLWANTFLTYINEHQHDQTTWSWIAGNNYLSTDEMCNNVMVIFKYMSGGFPWWLVWALKNENRRGYSKCIT